MNACETFLAPPGEDFTYGIAQPPARRLVRRCQPPQEGRRADIKLALVEGPRNASKSVSVGSGWPRRLERSDRGAARVSRRRSRSCSVKIETPRRRTPGRAGLAGFERPPTISRALVRSGRAGSRHQPGCAEAGAAGARGGPRALSNDAVASRELELREYRRRAVEQRLLRGCV